MRYLFLTSLLTLALSVGSSFGQTANEYFNMGNDKGRAGDKDAAIAYYDQALLMNPRLLPALNNRAYAKLLKHDWDGALTDCGLALEIDPKCVLAYNNRCAVKFGKGDLIGAIEDCNQAISLDPKNVLAHDNMAKLKTLKGDLKTAVSEYMIVMSLNPNIPQPYNGLGWMYATASDPSIRNGAKAIEYATQACNLTQWKNAADLDTFAAACAEVGDFDQAVKWESEYLKVDPSSKTALARLALYQARQPYHQAPPLVNPSNSPTPAPKP